MALPRYNDIVELIKKGATFEAQEKILELRESAMDLQEENLSLREELSKLKAIIKKSESLSFENGVYWFEKNSKKEGPFCPTCYDNNGKEIRLHSIEGSTFGNWGCKVCNCSYE